MTLLPSLPHADPGSPDTRSPLRFLVWVGRKQFARIAIAVGFGVTWMVAQALMPYALGRAVDSGLAAGDRGALLYWALAVLALGLIQAGAGVLRHRLAVGNWLTAMYRVTQLVAEHVARTGSAVRSAVSTGEVVSTTASDAPHIGGIYDVLPRFFGAITAYVLVAVLLLSTSVTLGLVVLIGVPLVMLLLTPVIRPLQARQREQRAEIGRLTALGADTVAGLRVLRGIGGERTFLARYTTRSQEVRQSGLRVAQVQSLLDAAQVLLPGIFVVLVTWLGARLAVAGTISPGELVAFYGYSAFLVTPLRTATEAVERATRGIVAARRVLAVLAVSATTSDAPADNAPPARVPAAGVPLRDSQSGLVVAPGLTTALVSADPQESALVADRLGRFADGDGVLLGDVRLADLAVDEVRRRILVSEADPLLFSGSLRETLDPWGTSDDRALRHMLTVADATDVIDALPDGLDTTVEERGRSFSGGQRQRLVLARALLADPEVLVLVEPTSAVDAHTEARIADRLLTARRGRTTVIVSASPLLLDRVDQVAFLADGRVQCIGTHAELLESEPSYRETVTREEAA